MQMLSPLLDRNNGFTGYLSIESAYSLYLLLFYNSSIYCAVKLNDNACMPITVRQFFQETGATDKVPLLVSVHATDPLLLKSLLIYLQNPPLLEAPSEFVDLDAAAERIAAEKGDALIVANKPNQTTFHFFSNGSLAITYADEAMPVKEEPAATINRIKSDCTSANTMIRVYKIMSVCKTEEAQQPDLEEVKQLWSTAPPSGRNDLIILVTEGPQQGERLCGPLPCVIGRKETDIVLSDPLVSKRHAAIQLVNGKLIIMDLSSTNGTFVNGSQIRQMELAVGDDILLGSTLLKVEKLSPT